jgi:ABC-type multidrug transport system ATPase subunit
MNTPAVEVKDLEKSFRQKRVLDGLDLEIQRGSVFCLQGPNGAGKTTTVHILSTLLHADRFGEHDQRPSEHHVEHLRSRVRLRHGPWLAHDQRQHR